MIWSLTLTVSSLAISHLILYGSATGNYFFFFFQGMILSLASCSLHIEFPLPGQLLIGR